MNDLKMDLTENKAPESLTKLQFTGEGREGYGHCKLPLVEPGIDYCISDLSELRKTFILRSCLDI